LAIFQDKSISLAFSINANPGVYAVLLGSGVSRSAGIPTGWEIVLDLCKKLGHMHGEQVDKPEKWYQEKFGEEPRYDDLLDRLTTTSDERQALLQSYFEPTEEENESGLKQPSQTHRSLAKLIKDGYVRMILTTNFDRLMEKALEEEGVTYDVAASEDAIHGIRPYVHSKCTLIKLHGDYKDTRIKNTQEELSVYPDALNKLLDRIFDEFGLVIAGWSGTWDIALRNAILRISSRRYGWFWLSVGEPSEQAKELINHRDGQVIKTSGADDFFKKLELQVDSIQELGSKNPLSRKLSVEMAKKFIKSKRHIDLYDLITNETQKVREYILTAPISYGSEDIRAQYKNQLEIYEKKSENLNSILATMAYFDKGIEHSSLLTKTIERLNFIQPVGGSSDLIELRRLPALIAMYACGISAVASGNFQALKDILINTKPYDSSKKSILEEIEPYQVFEYRLLDEEQINSTPVNMLLYNMLWEYFVPYPLTEEEYTSAFDLFEFIYGLIYVERIGSLYTPVGCFIWRRSAPQVVKSFLREGYLLRDKWSFIKYLSKNNNDLFTNTLSSYQNEINESLSGLRRRNQYKLQEWFSQGE
jgi:hypothetical protein